MIAQFAIKVEPSLADSWCRRLWAFARSRLALGGALTSASPLQVICGDLSSSRNSQNRALTNSKIRLVHITNSNHQQPVETQISWIPRITSSCICVLRTFSLPVSGQGMCGYQPCYPKNKSHNITANNLSPDHKALAGGWRQLVLTLRPVVQVYLCCRIKLVSWPLDGFATTSIRLVPSSSRPGQGPTPRTYF